MPLQKGPGGAEFVENLVGRHRGLMAGRDGGGKEHPDALGYDRSARHPIHPADHAFGAQFGDDRVQVLQIPHREVDHHIGEVLGAALHRNVVDIAVMVSNHLRDLRQRARLVNRLQREARPEALRRTAVNIPAHVEPSIRLAH